MLLLEDRIASIPVCELLNIAQFSIILSDECWSSIPSQLLLKVQFEIILKLQLISVSVRL